MTHSSFVIAQLEEINPEAILFDGLDAAVIGIADRFGMPSVALYDYEKCIAIFQEDGMSRGEGEDWFGFNVIGAYVGESTPVFAALLNSSDDEDYSI